MSMKKLAVIIVLAGSCDKTDERSADHLRSLGYKVVACSSESHGEALCAADDARFRCASAETSPGCNNSGMIACERFYVERPAP